MVVEQYQFHLNPESATTKVIPEEFVIKLTDRINSSKPVDSDKTYTDFLAGITEIIKKYSSQLSAKTPIFHQRLERIGRHEQTIKTDWGGVFFTEASESGDHVEKYLIVKQATAPAGVLGFEYHKRKKENLKIEEGYVLLMKAETPGTITLTFAGPGDTCELLPPAAHGIIPLTNCTILETSNYELDADDLLFIFRSVI